MSLRAQWIAGALGLALVACGEDRAAALRAEIQRLEAERIEAPAVRKARAEAEEAQLETERLRATLADTRAASGAVAKASSVLTRAAASEQAAAARLREEAAAVLEDAQRELDALPALEARIAEVQARAEIVRRQADLLLQEIRPDDPAWATERRLRTLTEFAERVARENPQDPALVSVAERLRSRRPLPAPGDASPRELAARLRDRMQQVFDLPLPTAPGGVEGSASVSGASPHPRTESARAPREVDLE